MSTFSSHEIVRVTSESLSVLHIVDSDCFDAQIDEDTAAECVASPDTILVVAVSEGRVVGQCLAAIQRHPDKAHELYVSNLGVATSDRRRGIATELVQTAMSIARERGTLSAWIAVEPDNVGAAALYTSMGLQRATADIFDCQL